MKVIQKIEIITEATEEELKDFDLNEYEQELFEQVKDEAYEDATVKVEVIVKK